MFVDHVSQNESFDNALVALKNDLIEKIDGIAEIEYAPERAKRRIEVAFCLELLKPFFESVNYGYKMKELEDRLELVYPKY